MINEKQFVESFNSYWKSILPLSKFFLKEVNRRYTKSDNNFLESNIVGRRRSFLSEIAFKLLKESYELNYDIYENQNVYLRLDLIEKKCKELFKIYEKDENGLTEKLNDNEISEILTLAKRMKVFLNNNYTIENLVISPKFIGCGFVETCYGDILINDTLLEVKMVNRNFQLNDFKQVITYCALNSVSNTYDIKNIGIYNPRKGRHVIYELNDLCLNISGKTSLVLLGEIIDLISNSGMSK
ncbi:hypothetical protein [Clostridium beijerinckii]|uniref:hypothetical protein n=1 Tax=Clostridium beijerinckii TaxID=1520 RepID=UPI001570901C|nr:hypothetical protein [Clostridium beijerinckii]NRT72061.1 hypothetical protein [Clostridium beijerinckii]